MSDSQNTLFPKEVQAASMIMDNLMETVATSYSRQPDLTAADRMVSAYGFLLESLNRIAFSKTYMATAGMVQRREHAVFNLAGVLGDQAGIMLSPMSDEDRAATIQNMMGRFNVAISNPQYLVDEIEMPPERFS